MKTKNEILREIAEQRIHRAHVASCVAFAAMFFEGIFLALIVANSLFSIVSMAWLVVMFAAIDKTNHLEEMAKRDVELMDEEGE